MSEITQLLKTTSMFTKTVCERVNGGVSVTVEDLAIIDTIRQRLEFCSKVAPTPVQVHKPVTKSIPTRPSPELVYTITGCAGFNYNKPENKFRPCKRNVCSSAGMCRQHRVEFIRCGGNLLYGYNEIRGGKCNYLNKKQWTYYPDYTQQTHGVISNPIIRRFLRKGNLIRPEDYKHGFTPTRAVQPGYFVPLDEEEFIRSEKELSKI